MIVAVVLAAGEGRRFGGPVHKLRVALDDTPLVRRAVDSAIESKIGPVLVVTGAVEIDDLLPAGVTVVRNARWATGQASSLRAGIDVADALGADAVVVGLADMPSVDPTVWQAVGAASGDLVTASYDGHRSPPVRIARALWTELPSSGDEGARWLMRRRPEWVDVVDVPGPALDIDVPDDLPTVGKGRPE